MTTAWTSLPLELRHAALVALGDLAQTLRSVDQTATSDAILAGLEALQTLEPPRVRKRERSPEVRDQLVLSTLQSRGDWCSTREIGRVLGWDRWSTRFVLDRLVTAGLIEKSGPPRGTQYWRAKATPGA